VTEQSQPNITDGKVAIDNVLVGKKKDWQKDFNAISNFQQRYGNEKRTL